MYLGKFEIVPNGIVTSFISGHKSFEKTGSNVTIILEDCTDKEVNELFNQFVNKEANNG